MTEKSPTLLSSMFTPQPKGLSRNSALLGDRSSGADSDNSFSRELSLATGQRQSTRAVSSEPRQDGAASSNSRPETKDPATSRLRDSSPKQTQTKSDSPASSNTSVSQRDQPSSDDVDSTRVEKPAEADAAKADPTSASTTSPISDSTSELPSDPIAQLVETELKVGVITDVDANVPVGDASKVASSVANGLQTDADKPDVLPTAKLKGLETGTVLMPAQLHAHQLQQTNRAEALQAEKVATDITLVDATKVKSTTPAPIAVAAQTSTAALLAGASKSQIEAQSISVAATPQGDPEQAAPLLEDANPIASLSAQRRPNLSDTLADAKVQAQQAAEQKQVLEVDQSRVKQLAQQQALASASTNAIVQETGDSSPDNMSHSILSGIGTAPALQRTDAANAQLANAPMNIPILHKDADKAMAGNIRWMVNENVKQAVVNVTPSGMGPISVSIGLENEQMNISIVAAQGSTREALDSMLPRLREQLQAQGHDGVKVDISDGRSENSGNEHARNADNSEQGEGAENENANSLASKEQARKIENSTSDVAAVGDMEGLMLVDKYGQLQGGYDIYV